MLREGAKHICGKMYDWGICRRSVLNKIVQLEGGEFYSQKLREVFKRKYDIQVGMYTYGGIFNHYNIARGTTIGRYCSVAPLVYIYSKNHPFNRMSQHPFFYNPDLGYVKELNINVNRLTIGHDVWIGQNAIITASVDRIGIGAVVAAGSIVTKNVPDFSIVAGNPASIIKLRFDERRRARILESEWWNKSIDDIVRGDFDDFLNDFNEL